MPQDDRPPRTRPRARMVLKQEEYLCSMPEVRYYFKRGDLHGGLTLGIGTMDDLALAYAGRYCADSRLRFVYHLYQRKVGKPSRLWYCCVLCRTSGYLLHHLNRGWHMSTFSEMLGAR